MNVRLEASMNKLYERLVIVNRSLPTYEYKIKLRSIVNIPDVRENFRKDMDILYQFDRTTKRAAIFIKIFVDSMQMTSDVFFVNNKMINIIKSKDQFSLDIIKLDPVDYNNLFEPGGDLNLFKFDDFNTDHLKVRKRRGKIIFSGIGFDFPGPEIIEQVDMFKTIVANAKTFIIQRARAEYDIETKTGDIIIESRGTIRARLIAAGCKARVDIPKKYVRC